MRKILLPLVLALATTAGVLTGIERGNRLYRDGRYTEAVEAYRQALARGDDDPVLRYNLGTALLRLGRYAEAEDELRAALDAVDPEVRERVVYNLGQRYLADARSSEDPRATRSLYDAAVEAYRQALRLRPGDGDAKWNYELALREREDQPPPPSGGDGDQQPQPRDQPPAGGGDGDGGSTGSQDPDGDDASAGGAPMSREQAERILSAVEQDERELVRDKLRKGREVTRAERDW